MNAYFDLSILVHSLISIVSLRLSLVICDRKSSYSYQTNHFFLTLIAYVFNLYYIPYIFLFYSILRIGIVSLWKQQYFKVEIITLGYYWLNIAFLLLVGGTFIYDGILLINRPIATLFVLILPIISIILFLFERQLQRAIRKHQYICKATLMIDHQSFHIQGYYDSGNFAYHKDLPVIFVNFEFPTSCIQEEIKIQGLEKNKMTYFGTKATLYLHRKTYACYVISNPHLVLTHQCNCLLNLELFH